MLAQRTLWGRTGSPLIRSRGPQPSGRAADPASRPRCPKYQADVIQILYVNAILQSVARELHANQIRDGRQQDASEVVSRGDSGRIFSFSNYKCTAERAFGCSASTSMWSPATRRYTQ